uniref:DNA sulfur modification protein DndC n=1 Tax=Candidatus Kentrum sp. UNK TaxID=2126344 RepID=A0A451AEN0_9GAMM|nr:MAG: DNA sulfur modification protein DndC [Candidatus Kentron sp. UNK]VFK71110.1 MAG: DNA sulfur modification protein DndC [Candidatus Kentron sp. UNK]
MLRPYFHGSSYWDLREKGPSYTAFAAASALPNRMSKIEKNTLSELNDLYQSDDRPWVVAFSGGKDSTLLLQLVFELLISLGKQQASDVQAAKPVYVVASDTRVEPPNVEAYLKGVLAHIEAGANQLALNLSTHLVTPEPQESFWGKLIGKGYPSPTRWFRWCTANMKIRPTRRVIEEITREHGSAVLLLGTRVDESIERGKRMRDREHTSRGLNPHHEIPDALVATPIADWRTDDVWEYLFHHNPPPWGGSHDFLLDLYRQAAGGECPIILDLDTPSCGGSRFGCWTCTVVKEDKSMQGFIDTGETWMQPLAEFRNWLKEIRERPECRLALRRDGSNGPGPFSPECRKEILEKLLKIENDLGLTLVSDEGLRYIQAEWRREFDLAETATTLARRYGRELQEMPTIKLPPIEQQVLDDLIAEHAVNPDLVDKLLKLVLYDYKDLYRNKAALQREIAERIEVSLEQTGSSAHSGNLLAK